MSSYEPSEELLSRVRLMSRFFAEIQDEKSRYIRERQHQIWLPHLRPEEDHVGIFRDVSLFDLDMPTGAIRVSSTKMSRGLLKKEHRVSYQVTERGTVLEFVDIVRGSGTAASVELESVEKYEPGDWVQKLEPIYRRCLGIQNLREQIPLIERKVQRTENAPEIVKLVEESREPKYAVNLLLLGDNYDTNSARLFGAYLEVGRISEAVKFVRWAALLHPKDAQLRLMLGNLYWAALCNAKGWAPGLDLGALTKITLEVLNCDYRSADVLAELFYKDAIDLATDQKTARQASDQLRTLKMMDELYGHTGNRD